MKLTLIFLFMLIAAVTPPATADSLHEVREVHYQMGTFLEMTLWHGDPDAAKRLLRDAVAEVHRLEEILSNYDPDSAVSRLNRRAGTGPVDVPAELFEVLKAARQFSEKTDGLFDVTVGSLMELWRKAEEERKLPILAQLIKARAAASYRNLVLRYTKEAELIHPETRIDLGGIGKGYAVDVVAQKLKSASVTAALINFGGSSMFAIGAPPGTIGWKIGLQAAGGGLVGFIYLHDAALSTSGSMGRSWMINGKRYGHLIDPLSGMPMIETRMATVIAPSATAAEALTKPMVLRGKSALPMIQNFPGAEAVVTSAKERPAFSPRFSVASSWKEIRLP